MLMITGFSTAPLRLASLVGFAFTLLGILAFLYVLLQYFTVGSVPGFPFLASLISLFAGAQLFALGIIGEYLARIFQGTLHQPAYVVSRVVERSSAAD
jgi:undecaprenyl-phosphate 4-deoxy-4-formamido-L-arabinose transferase